MISEEMKKEILAKIGKDKEAVAMMNKHDIRGLIAKCKDAGFDMTENDITEIVVGSTGGLSEEELNMVTGGEKSGIYGLSGSGMDIDTQNIKKRRRF